MKKRRSAPFESLYDTYVNSYLGAGEHIVGVRVDTPVNEPMVVTLQGFFTDEDTAKGRMRVVCEARGEGMSIGVAALNAMQHARDILAGKVEGMVAVAA